MCNRFYKYSFHVTLFYCGDVPFPSYLCKGKGKKLSCFFKMKQENSDNLLHILE